MSNNEIMVIMIIYYNLMSNNEIMVIMIIMIDIIPIRVFFLIIECPSMIRVVPRPEDDNSRPVLGRIDSRPGHEFSHGLELQICHRSLVETT